MPLGAIAVATLALPEPAAREREIEPALVRADMRIWKRAIERWSKAGSVQGKRDEAQAQQTDADTCDCEESG